MIKIRNLNKHFYQGNNCFKALENINLHIKPQDIFGIIGFSGAGKSTLVRCLNLLERPDEGSSIIVDNDELLSLNEKQLREKRSKIGFIFQHFNLMPSRNVLDNVLFPLAYKGIKKSQRVKKALDLLELVGLSSKANNYVHELSGGQKQRVAIARALANDPKILLCDEATSALDPNSTHEILELLKTLNQKLKLTIVLITHELAVVKQICNKVAVMEHGQVVECADVFDVFANPSSKAAISFINKSSNLNKIDKLLAKSHLLNLQENDVLVRLLYTDKGISEPLISNISHKFNLIMNILYADIELINNSPVGGTVGVLSGKQEDIRSAIAYLKAKNVKVEELLHG